MNFQRNFDIKGFHGRQTAEKKTRQNATFSIVVVVAVLSF